jgi:hypothetical protein
MKSDFNIRIKKTQFIELNNLIQLILKDESFPPRISIEIELLEDNDDNFLLKIFVDIPYLHDVDYIYEMIFTKITNSFR